MNVRKADLYDKACEILGEIAPTTPCEHLGTEHCEHLCNTDDGIYAACWDEYIRQLCAKEKRERQINHVMECLDEIKHIAEEAYDGHRDVVREDYWDILHYVADVRNAVIDLTTEGR